jgi:hypothetical protein
VFPEQTTKHLNQVFVVTVGVYVDNVAPDMLENPVVDDVVDNCHWYVTPVPAVAFCSERFTVPLGAATVAEEESVFPGFGVPEQTGITGGVQVYVKPDAGLTVLESVMVEVFNVPAVVDDQFVVVVLLLNAVAPRIPT